MLKIFKNEIVFVSSNPVELLQNINSNMKKGWLKSWSFYDIEKNIYSTDITEYYRHLEKYENLFLMSRMEQDFIAFRPLMIKRLEVNENEVIEFLADFKACILLFFSSLIHSHTISTEYYK